MTSEAGGDTTLVAVLKCTLRRRFASEIGFPEPTVFCSFRGLEDSGLKKSADAV